MTDEFTRLLEERRDAIMARLRARAEDLDALAASRSAATADDEHDPEGSTLSDEWSTLAGLDAEARRELTAVDAALRRIAEGTYGRCETCGSRIPLARLRLRPAATQCVACASR